MTCSIRILALSAVAGLAVASPMTRPLTAQTVPVVRDSTLGRHRIQVLPALGSAPETGLQYGITSFAVFERPPMARTRPATAMAYAIRTAKSQTRIGIEGEHWSTGNDRRLAGTLVWQEYPLPFYGIGDRTPETAKEIFSPRGIEATATVQQRLARSLYGLSTLRIIDQTITPDSTGALRVSGLTGVNGGRIVELTLGALDDTRDNLFAPAAGHLVQLSYGRGLDGLGSDFDYGRIRLDARAYRAMGGSGVLAGQVVAVGMDGAAPFDGIAMVGGGDIMRGYARGRYRDSWFTGAQAEYRTPMRRRVGAVLFGGAGFVAPRLGALFDGQVLPTYGAGLRVGLDATQRTAVRMDYGRGRAGNSGLYIGFNQAF
ncbi:MAG: BamA/TamA family outer membrane protein [Gemmatimonadota bacterium]